MTQFMLFCILISSCSSCQLGWHRGGRAGGSGPRLRHRQDRERHREGGLMTLMSESQVCPMWGLYLITLWGCLFRNLRTLRKLQNHTYTPEMRRRCRSREGAGTRESAVRPGALSTFLYLPHEWEKLHISAFLSAGTGSQTPLKTSPPLPPLERDVSIAIVLISVRSEGWACLSPTPNV